MLWSSTSLVTLSGTVYGWMRYAMTSSDPYSVVHHPLQPLVLKIHIVSAPFLVFAVGLVFTQHVLRQWRSGLKRGRRTGLVTMLAVPPMVLSGYLIQAVTHEGWLWWLAATHLVASGLYVLGFAGHRSILWLREAAARRRVLRARASHVAATVAAGGRPLNEPAPRISRAFDPRSGAD